MRTEDVAVLRQFESAFLLQNEHGPVPEGSTALADLHEVFRKNMYMPDSTVVDVAVGTAVAHRLGGDPLWTMLVGPPGGGKTEVIQSLTDLDEVHELSSLTARTFASGLKGRTDASLFRRLERDGKSFITMKDFGSVLSLHREARAEILATLREVYDGSFVKEFGSGETVRWQGRLGVLAGVTPAIDTHHAVAATLGERFLLFRLPRVPRRNLSAQALSARGQETQIRAELRATVRAFVAGLDLLAVPTLSTAADERLMALADLATIARSAVARESYSSREILAVPEPEAPTRFVKQTAALALALTAMGHQEAPALAIVARVASDSVPPGRLTILRTLAGGDEMPRADVASAVSLPLTTVRRTLEELSALHLVVKMPGHGGPGGSDRWALSEEGRRLWDDAALDPDPAAAVALIVAELAAEPIDEDL